MRQALILVVFIAFICLAGCTGEADQITSAIAKNDKQAIETVLKAHPKAVNRTNSTGKTPLMAAVEAGSLDMVRFLLEKKADVNGKDKKGQTAMHYVALSNKPESPEIVKALLAKGADVNARNNEGLTPLGLAKRQGVLRGAAYVISRNGGTD